MTLDPGGALTCHRPKLSRDVADDVMHMPFVWGAADSKLETCVLNESVDVFSTSEVMIVTLWRSVCF
jgi:hypothetical protein